MRRPDVRNRAGGWAASSFTIALAAGCASSSGAPGAARDGGATADDASGDDGGSTRGDACVTCGDGSYEAGVPLTCADAAAKKSYVGCDYWPTVTANVVSDVFDFAVAVANTGNVTASVNVTGPSGFQTQTTVPPQGLTKIYLPWVPELKGPYDGGSGGPFASVLSKSGAYHLVSSDPVSVYQFDALEYKGVGGPPNKSWAGCNADYQSPEPCFSYSNDASILLPSTALTGNYRLAGYRGDNGWSSFVAVTATENGTTLKIKVASTGGILAGNGIAAAPPGSIVSYALDAGDVLQLFSGQNDTDDITGSLVQANRPVQVITGHPCAVIGRGACDHIEQSTLPVETLGRHYFVAAPTGPVGNVPQYAVRLVGHVDGTHLTFGPSAPPQAPAMLDAGQVIDLGAPLGYIGGGFSIAQSFEVAGDQPFAVSVFMLGADTIDLAGMHRGDPSQSLAVPVEQYRGHYVFLAPDDYEVSFADVIAPASTSLTLDGTAVGMASTPIASGFGVVRIPLGPGKGGAHVLDATQPVGLQVMGYGSYTSYLYPGGADLSAITPPPPPIQ
jgi:hypothetical protein